MQISVILDLVFRPEYSIVPAEPIPSEKSNWLWIAMCSWPFWTVQLHCIPLQTAFEIWPCICSLSTTYLFHQVVLGRQVFLGTLVFLQVQVLLLPQHSLEAQVVLEVLADSGLHSNRSGFDSACD